MTAKEYIGKRVRIINKGHAHTAYKTIFAILNVHQGYMNKVPKNNTSGVIRDSYSYHNTKIYLAIETKDGVFVMDSDGVEIISNTSEQESQNDIVEELFEKLVKEK